MRTRIRSSLLVLSATFGLIAAQEPSESQHQDPKERLQELIEKAKELESFHAVYKISSPTRGDGDARFHYSKPDRLAFRSTIGELSCECVIVGSRMSLLVRGGEEEGTFASVNCIPVPDGVVEEALGAVRGQFPEADIAPPADALGPSIILHCARTKEGEALLSYNISNPLGCEMVLGWLQYLRVNGRLVEESSDFLTFEGGYQSTFVVRKSTGFIESARVPWEGGDKTLQLVDLELDHPIEASAFETTDPDSDMSDESATLEAQLFWQEAQWMRQVAAGAIVKLVEQDRLTWDDAARLKAREAFVGLHAAIVESQASDGIESMRSWIDAVAARFQLLRAQAGDDPKKLAALDKEVEEGERSLREWIDENRGGFGRLRSCPCRRRTPVRGRNSPRSTRARSKRRSHSTWSAA